MKKLLVMSVLSLIGFYPFIAQAETGVIEAVANKAIENGFSELEKQIIEKYFKQESKNTTDKETKEKKKDKNKKLPPGLAKKETLPPGLAKQLERNGTLPPGLAKRNLPADLEAELPASAEGLERTIVDNAVVLVEKATGRIIDVMKDVVTGN